MLFNSWPFLLVFLPLALLGFYGLGKMVGPRAGIAWLALASLAFYGYWNPLYVGLLMASVVANFGLGVGLAKTRAKSLLTLGVTANLALLAYYKYSNFFVANFNHLAGTNWTLGHIILPLGISFFTFTQIAFLVDSYRGLAVEYNFLSYLLFVTFFPHLIAGPILHHKQMMSQFASKDIFRWNSRNFAIGWTIFALGMFKKVVIADGIAPLVGPVFGAAPGTHITFLDGWVGTLAYTLQLYFDFSGYSDMAVGLGLLFNIRLPINFFSPYQSKSIIEFWRRWHMTLSQYLRNYLYIPLGGNRKGKFRRYLNLMITMLLGGLWHGAGWTFVIWGGLHGLYLVINHGWRAVMGEPKEGKLAAVASQFLTFLAAAFAWVFFRASNLSQAVVIARSLVGLNGVSLPQTLAGKLGKLASFGFTFDGSTPLYPVSPLYTIGPIALLIVVVMVLPNVNELVRDFEPSLSKHERVRAFPWLWKPSLAWGVILGVACTWALFNLNHASEFLYFQF